ncbi:MAG: Na/Pi symporter [Bacteroidetes bacterium]|nr:Na/Pi symporter [Bacteroidota bacterium]MDA0902933.1 Na/Pi symporter [Bacteroidota bacterium]MDA1241651.1 Na/Pi symporter [Bacteroidota bacterium]
MIWIKWLLSILGGLAVFLFGMRTLSDAIRRVSATSFREFLSSITKSTWVGTLTGLFVTSLLQSSSAVTVTLVSLVNAGLLTVRESVGVLLGANIGTTITAWLIVLSLGGFSLSDMALPIAGLAVPLLLMERRVSRQVANMMIGFALLFIGLNLLKGQMEVLGARELFTSIFPEGRGGLKNNLVFLLLGASLTALIQSSSAATALTLAAMVSGLIGLESALAMVLGENIGTTLTANLAAVVGNRASKRVARIHFLINSLGSLWMIGLVPFMAEMLSTLFSGVESLEVRNGYVLAMFHTTFNVINALMLGLGIDTLINFSKKLVWVEDNDMEQDTGPSAIPGRIVDAEFSLEEIRSDMRRSGGILKRMVNALEELMGVLDPTEREDILNHLAKWEERTDRLEQTIAAKLSAVTQLELSPALGARVAALSSINPDLERVGDMLLNMGWQLDTKERNGVYFLPRQRGNVIQMFGLLREAIQVMDNQLKADHVDLDAVAEVEGKINSLRNQLRERHLKDVERGKYPASSGVLYSELITSLEECGDRIAHVSAQLAEGARVAKRP